MVRQYTCDGSLFPEKARESWGCTNGRVSIYYRVVRRWPCRHDL
jgi:hypothetical protein